MSKEIKDTYGRQAGIRSYHHGSVDKEDVIDDTNRAPKKGQEAISTVRNPGIKGYNKF